MGDSDTWKRRFTLWILIVQLDMAVWDIRRYCRVLDYEIKLPNGRTQHMLDVEIRTIEHSETRPPQSFRWRRDAREDNR